MMYRASLMLALVVPLVLLGCASQQSAPKESSNKVLLILRGSRGWVLDPDPDTHSLDTDEFLVLTIFIDHI